MAPPGFGRATQPNPRSSKNAIATDEPADASGSEPDVGHPSSAVAPSARRHVARPNQRTRDSWRRTSARTNRRGSSQTASSSSSRCNPSRRLLRPRSATAYRDRGQQAHQPTGWSDRAARTPGESPSRTPSTRTFDGPSESHPTANSVRVLQKALHQQRRVFRDVANSAATSPRSRSRTGRVVSIGMLHPSEAIRPSRGPGSIWVGLPLTSGPTEACAPGPAVNIASRLSKTPVIWSTLAGMPETGPWRDRGSSLARGRRPPDASARVPLTLRTHETRSALSATRDSPTDLQPHIPLTGLLTRGGRVGAGRAR